jgi:arylsulfatase A-like enzyme
MTLEKTFTQLDAKLETPGSLSPEQVAEWNKYYGPRNEAFKQANLRGQDLVRWRYNRYMHDYLGCVKAVDEAVGRVLQCLEDEGIRDETIVVYSSDQGFYLGEHGWFDKRWVLEESLRTPLLVSWPGVTKPGSVNTQLTSVLDFAETFLDVAGIPIPPEMQGRSLVPLLAGENPPDWRKSFYYHYYEYPVPHRVRPHYGVVTDRYKLVHFYKPDVDYWELYDRQKDPHEVRSYYEDPAYAETIAELKAELARLRKELKVPAEAPRAAYGNRPFENEPAAPAEPAKAKKKKKAAR